MNKKTDTEILSGVLSEDPAGILKTAEELEAMLDKELSKSEDETDYGLVNQLSMAVCEASGNNAYDIDVPRKLMEFKAEKAARKSHFRIPKWSVGFIAACFVLICGNIYTVSAWDMNVFSFIVEFTKGGAIIDFKKTPDEIVLPTSEDDPYGILEVCRENGINIETPHYLPDRFILTYLETDPEKRYICMTYKKNKNDKEFINLTFSGFNERFLIPSDEHNLSEIKINGHDAVMSREDNQMVVVFSSSDSMLTIMTQDVDYDECDKILENIK